MSDRPSAWNTSAPIGCIVMKYHISVIVENLLRNFRFSRNMAIIAGNLHVDRCTFIILPCSVLLE